MTDPPALTVTQPSPARQRGRASELIPARRQVGQDGCGLREQAGTRGGGDLLARAQRPQPVTEVDHLARRLLERVARSTRPRPDGPRVTDRRAALLDAPTRRSGRMTPWGLIFSAVPRTRESVEHCSIPLNATLAKRHHNGPTRDQRKDGMKQHISMWITK